MLARTLPWVGGSLALLAVLALLRRPLGGLLRLAFRTGAGYLCLSVLAPVGQFIGAGLGINLFNSLVLGILGVPGLGLLLMLNWVLR
ncbi:MAG: pro-sigmaK processing inhibitor BofA family protein [Clostridiales bacterium]|nr:pro-sigmaK processing inhibitor BofA family protein [Clostridiales bacterium]